MVITTTMMQQTAFAKVASCLREIEVSHWGNIAVEEFYDIEHHGAKLEVHTNSNNIQMHNFEHIACDVYQYYIMSYISCLCLYVDDDATIITCTVELDSVHVSHTCA
jgi:Ribophorin I